MAKKGRTRAPSAARISPEDMERALAGGGPAPCYILVGPEAILRDRALDALKRRQVDPEFELFNYRLLSPAGLDGSALAQELRVLPMGGGGRMVVIRPAEKLLKDQLAALAGYLAEPAPGTCLVLVAGELREGLKKAFKGAVAVDCGSPYEDRIPALLMEEARKTGVRLDPPAAAAIAGRCGRDLTRAISELSKAVVNVGEGGTVTRAVVENLTGGDASGDVFKVASALARGDIPAAVGAARLYLETEDRGEPRVLFELGLHLRRLLAARGNMASGLGAREAAKAAGVFWKDQEAFSAGMRAWTEPRIREAYRRLLDADRRVKRGWDGLPAIEAYLWGLPVGRRPAAQGGRAQRSRFGR